MHEIVMSDSDSEWFTYDYKVPPKSHKTLCPNPYPPIILPSFLPSNHSSSATTIPLFPPKELGEGSN